jgi:hypothetical protein
MLDILKEAFVVGILVVVVGTLVGFGFGKLFSTDLPPVCKDWNKNYIMELSLFVTGFIAHILCEMTGINKWYCKNSVACRK